MMAVLGGGVVLLTLAGAAMFVIALIAKKAILASVISLVISLVMGIKKFLSQKNAMHSHGPSHMGPGSWEVPASMHGSGMDGGDPYTSSYHGQYSHYKTS